MKKKKLSLFVLGGITALVASAQAQAAKPIQPQNTVALRCEFVKEGQKGEDDRVCKAEFSLIPDLAASSVGSPPNNFEVRCDDDTVYSGGGFTKVAEFSGNPQFGIGIVTAIKNIQPAYPSVFVDGDFLDFSFGFEDRDARLYFSKDEYIRGKCDHEAIVRPAP